MSDKKDGSINIELSPELESGIYSNLAMVMHSQSEFVIDFIQLIPQHETAKVRSRVVMTPDNMKRLVRVMINNLQGFEQEYGVISLPEDNNIPQGEA